MSAQDADLQALIESLLQRVDGLEIKVKQLELYHQDVSEETMVAIAAAVAAFLGYRAKRRQASFTTSRNWTSSTRRLQHVHQPLHLR